MKTASLALLAALVVLLPIATASLNDPCPAFTSIRCADPSRPDCVQPVYDLVNGPVATECSSVVGLAGSTVDQTREHVENVIAYVESKLP